MKQTTRKKKAVKVFSNLKQSLHEALAYEQDKKGALRVRCPRSNQQIRVAEFPFNREQCWEFATRVRAECMASIAFHVGVFRYFRLSRQIRSGIYQGSVPG